MLPILILYLWLEIIHKRAYFEEATKYKVVESIRALAPFFLFLDLILFFYFMTVNSTFLKRYYFRLIELFPDFGIVMIYTLC